MSRYRFFVYIIGLVLLSGWMLVPPVRSQQHDYIDISNPFLRKIPIAIPYLRTAGQSAAEKELAVSMADQLSNALEFTAYFKMLDRGAFLADPHSDGPAEGINFRNWTAIGAELLITGGVNLAQGVIEVELRLYDTFKEQMVVGKRYKGWVDDQRRIVHRFCTEVIHILTGDRGLFESQIAFESKHNGYKEIYICDFDGYRPTQFTDNKTINLTPAWSSDSQWLAYTSYARGKPDLFIQNIKEKRGTVVAKPGINTTPAWVPGQFSLAATLSFEGDPEIYLLTGTGKIIKRLTNNYGIDVSPSWSPDGKKMAFVSNRAGSPQIYVQEVDTGSVQRLTYEGKYNTSPSWSPKGDRIAYSGMRDGVFDIFVIRADGSGLFQLTENSGDNESPSWSPDGSLIVFSSTRLGPSRIFVMTVFGTDQRLLLAIPGEQTNPEWSRGLIN